MKKAINGERQSLVDSVMGTVRMFIEKGDGNISAIPEAFRI